MAEHTYQYVRDCNGSGLWCINNPERLDPVTGQQIMLAAEIKASFPGRHICVFCSNDECDVIFMEDPPLNAAQQMILNNIVYDHQNNL
ncbi:MAG: hypothetical protein GWN00_01645 [Aliifodinibius sp.]|nr:hypothetical protein [Fodinibius sp.]NIV10004.1 hypothetical protein [Fodinibius sp.]NIY23565.1 hypothetical protein [Fodinibius sp.]